MKLLITILLWPLYCVAQFGGGAAQYTAETAIKFGALVNSTTLSNAQKASVIKDTLQLDWARTGVTIETWSGNSNRIEAYQAKNVKQIPVVNYYAGVPNPFLTSSQLA